MLSHAHRGGCRRHVPGFTPRHFRRPRRGIASALAMIYLVLFSALALGFFAQTTLSVQVSGNERRGAAAQAAAESGLAFLRYQLSRVKIPPTVAPADVFQEVHTQLAVRLNTTENIAGRTVGYTTGAIDLPAGSQEYITLGKDVGRFRATITPNSSGGLRAVVTGTDPTGRFRRALRVDFGRDMRSSAILGYGVATNGPITLSKGFIRGDPAALGDVYCGSGVSPQITLSGGTAAIDGKVYLASLSGSVSGEGSIAGVSDPVLRTANIVTNTPAPEFPRSDPTPFINYMQGRETLITGNTSDKYLSNIRIKAGTNPTLGNSPTIEGVILVEAPNQVTFSGTSGTTIRGVIVVVNPTETTSTNKINFTGGVSMYGAETLADSFGELRAMTGTSILAPNFNVEMQGGSTSIGGTILARNLVLSGASGGSIAGNIMLTGTAPLMIPQDSTITIKAPLTSGTPAGLVLTHSYMLLPKTYLEVMP